MLNNDKKRIGIDARFYGPLGKGLGRYTQEIVDNVIKLDKINDYVIFLSKENYNDFLADGEKVKKVLADVRWYTLGEQILMPYYIFKARLDLIHFPHFNVPIFCPIKFIITIHDLILTKYPTTRATTLGPILYKIKNFGYKIVIWLAVKRAKKVLAVSGFTKEDVIRHFHINPKKVVVTYEGVADVFFNKNENSNSLEILKKYKTNVPFLLYVGNAYPHKNLEGLVRVFMEMKKEDKYLDLKLVLVGKEDYFYKRVRQYAEGLFNEKNNEVVFPGYVPDNDLNYFYEKAAAYVFPSFYEGFGLPPLEAMARGCPVVSSNKTCLPEVLGQAAIYFNPENENEMKEQIIKLITDADLRQELISRGYEQAKKFSWEDCAEKTLAEYKNSII